MLNLQSQPKSIWIGRDRSRFSFLPAIRLLSDELLDKQYLCAKTKMRRPTSNGQHGKEKRRREFSNILKSKAYQIRSAKNNLSTEHEANDICNLKLHQHSNLKNVDFDLQNEYDCCGVRIIKQENKAPLFQNSALQGINFDSFNRVPSGKINCAQEKAIIDLSKGCNLMNIDINTKIQRNIVTKKKNLNVSNIEINSVNVLRRKIIPRPRIYAQIIKKNQFENLLGYSIASNKRKCIPEIKHENCLHYDDSEYRCNRKCKKVATMLSNEKASFTDGIIQNSLNSTSDDQCANQIYQKPITKGSILIKSNGNFIV